MNSLHLVDPAILPVLDLMPPLELTSDSLATARLGPRPVPPLPDNGVSVETVTISGLNGAPELDLIIYRPAAAAPNAFIDPLPCIFHIHGGGFVLGTASMFESHCRLLAAELDCVIVSVDYRLAPETVAPGAVEDCYAGLSWVFANAAARRIDPARIGVMGESAGGGHAAALALLARDRMATNGEACPLAFQHLIYPMLDDRTAVASDPHPYAGEFIWTAANNHFGWKSLLGHEPGIDGVSEYAAPARAADVSGLPPTFISVGALDIFVEENIEYARRLIRAGVPTELHVYPGAFHGFDLMPGAPVADAARSASIASLRKMLS